MDFPTLPYALIFSATGIAVEVLMVPMIGAQNVVVVGLL